ncbi:MAG: hypothetical protein P8M80_13865 [Pirellulaceae bacterium]|nr:hypothetical protein [Pirellulaceae bacterium]MDG2470362.1 hypothetical protein [Pirellulaceae bacterium]
MKFVNDDCCPECSERLQWDQHDLITCDNCGSEFDVDWDRMLEPIPDEDGN